MEHEELERRLASVDLELSGAEVHGLLCGLLCATSTDAGELWFGELFQQTEDGDLLLEECKQSLQRLYQQTHEAMADPGMGFALLLPSEEKPIRLRAVAVRDWCEGFLYGLGLGGTTGQSALSESTRESLNDFTEITRMNTDAIDEEDDAEEEALMQVTEFLRVAAMLVYDELAEGRAADR